VRVAEYRELKRVETSGVRGLPDRRLLFVAVDPVDAEPREDRCDRWAFEGERPGKPARVRLRHLLLRLGGKTLRYPTSSSTSTSAQFADSYGRTSDDEHELPVSSYEFFAVRDPLTRAVMDRMLAGVSTRKFARVGEPVGSEVEDASRSTSKSTVSELFIEKTRTALGELMGRRLEDVRLAVMMLDGLQIADRTHVVALGISTEGVKIPLGLWEGSTENATLARTLLADLVDRGLDPEQAILFVIDGGKAIRRAIKDVFGEHALVHRCHRHKERNVCDLLPDRDRPKILARIRGAWALQDADLAEQRLELLAAELQRTWPDAAASLREGMLETLTLMRLGIAGQLAKTLGSTNPCESMIEIVRYTQRNVKRWQDGDMRKRWTAAGMLVAEQQFRKIIGYRDLAKLVIAIERHTHLTAENKRQDTRERVTV